MSINKVILIGNVGNDPNFKDLGNDRFVVNFSLATSETYTNKSGEKITNTEWHNIVAWRGLANFVHNWIKKGSQIYIEGKITTRHYENDRKESIYVTEIIADSIQLLGRKPKDEETKD
jgi:single-strand DNA-binding protein